MALRAEARRFETDRTGTGADVPDDAVGAQLHARERHGAYFAFGDEPLVGFALVKTFIGESEEDGLFRRCAAPEHHHVGLGEILLRRIGRCEIGQQAFIRLQQTLGDCHAPVAVQVLGLQQARDARRCVLGAGKDREQVMLLNVLQQRIQAVLRPGTGRPLAGVLAVDGADARVLPWQPEARAGELQRGDIRQDFDCLVTQLVDEIPADAVTQRIAGGEYHGLAIRGARLLDPAGNLREFTGEIVGFRPRTQMGSKQGERAGSADHDIRLLNMLQDLCTEALRAIVQHTDKTAGFSHSTFLRLPRPVFSPRNRRSVPSA